MSGFAFFRYVFKEIIMVQIQLGGLIQLKLILGAIIRLPFLCTTLETLLHQSEAGGPLWV